MVIPQHSITLEFLNEVLPSLLKPLGREREREGEGDRERREGEGRRGGREKGEGSLSLDYFALHLLNACMFELNDLLWWSIPRRWAKKYAIPPSLRCRDS